MYIWIELSFTHYSGVLSLLLLIFTLIYYWFVLIVSESFGLVRIRYDFLKKKEYIFIYSLILVTFDRFLFRLFYSAALQNLFHQPSIFSMMSKRESVVGESAVRWELRESDERGRVLRKESDESDERWKMRDEKRFIHSFFHSAACIFLISFVVLSLLKG